jgi:hypothetical protein
MILYELSQYGFYGPPLQLQGLVTGRKKRRPAKSRPPIKILPSSTSLNSVYTIHFYFGVTMVQPGSSRVRACNLNDSEAFRRGYRDCRACGTDQLELAMRSLSKAIRSTYAPQPEAGNVLSTNFHEPLDAMMGISTSPTAAHHPSHDDHHDSRLLLDTLSMMVSDPNLKFAGVHINMINT